MADVEVVRGREEEERGLLRVALGHDRRLPVVRGQEHRELLAAHEHLRTAHLSPREGRVRCETAFTSPRWRAVSVSKGGLLRGRRGVEALQQGEAVAEEPELGGVVNVVEEDDGEPRPARLAFIATSSISPK